MPRVKRRGKVRQQRWTEFHRDIVCLGHDFCNTGLFGDELGRSGGKRGLDHEAMRECWEATRESALAWWIGMRPGTRPWAWWQWDMPEGTRRERLDGPHPFDDPNYDEPRELDRGLPRYVRAIDMRYGRRMAGEYETEAQYLERLSLLTAEECKMLQSERTHSNGDRN